MFLNVRFFQVVEEMAKPVEVRCRDHTRVRGFVFRQLGLKDNVHLAQNKKPRPENDTTTPWEGDSLVDAIENTLFHQEKTRFPLSFIKQNVLIQLYSI